MHKYITESFLWQQYKLHSRYFRAYFQPYSRQIIRKLFPQQQEVCLPLPAPPIFQNQSLYLEIIQTSQMTCLMYLKSGGKAGSKEVFAGKFSPTEDSMLISWTRAVVRGGEEIVEEARVTL